jgi:hypothetical protein
LYIKSIGQGKEGLKKRNNKKKRKKEEEKKRKEKKKKQEEDTAIFNSYILPFPSV